MALADMLLLTTVAVSRETVTPDGMGGNSTATTSQTLIQAALWQSGTGNRWMSDRMTRASTHVLACEPTAYTWTQDDRHVTYDGNTYKIVGRPEDVMFRGELTIVPLELLS